MFAITAPRVCEPHGQCVMAAPSPPRLSAAWRVEAPSFSAALRSGVFFRIAVYLCRCMALHDPVTYRESVHASCGRPFDITSCFFHIALWLGKCWLELNKVTKLIWLVLGFLHLARWLAMWDLCPLSDHRLHQEDLFNLVIHCRKKMQTMNILRMLIVLVHICVGDATRFLFIHQKCSDVDWTGTHVRMFLMAVFDVLLGIREG